MVRRSALSHPKDKVSLGQHSCLSLCEPQCWTKRPDVSPSAPGGICDSQTVCRQETVSANSLLSLSVTQPGGGRTATHSQCCCSWSGCCPRSGAGCWHWSSSSQNKAHPQKSTDVVWRFARHLQEDRMMLLLQII